MALKVWLPLNGTLENKGISDVTVTNNGATVDNNGKIGKCYNFNGSNSYLMGSSAPLSQNNNEWSYCCWFKPNNQHTGCLYSNRTAVDVHGITIFYAAGNFYVDDGERWTFAPSPAIKLNEWNHIVFVRKSNGYKKFYLNGVLNSSTTVTGNPTTIANASRFYIGRSQDSDTTVGGNALNGYLNDVRIYDHALSAKEVKEISQGLVLHYKLDNPYIEGTTNLIQDYDTSFETLQEGSSTLFINQMGSNAIQEIVTYNGIKCLHLQSAGSTGRVYKTLSSQADKTYTLSCEYFCDTAKNGAWRLERQGGDYSWAASQVDYTTPGNWQKLFITVTNTSNTTFYYFIYGDTGKDVYVKNFQIEEKDHPTPYTKISREQINYIKDSSGYENDLIVKNNVTITSNSIRYNAKTYFINGSYAISPKASNSYLPTDGLTVNLWIYCTTWGNPISCTEGGGWNFEKTSSGIQFPVYISGIGYKVANSGIQADTLLNSWHMLTGTFDKNSIKIYIDSVLKATTATGSTNGIGYVANGLCLAAEAESLTNPSNSAYVGDISDVRIYATALSAEDILDLYHTSASVDNFNNIHAFELEEDSSSRELLALPWTNGYGTHNKNSWWKNFTEKGEWFSNTSSSSSGSDYIKINPTGKTYYYDTEISVAAGNQFYIGFERYDANKTSRSNNACAYIVAIKPSSNLVHQRYFGTVDLSTDGVNPTDTIALRILNGWSGTDSSSTKEATIHYLSLREVTGNPLTGKIEQTGQINTDEFVEKENHASIYKNGFVSGNNLIEK